MKSVFFSVLGSVWLDYPVNIFTENNIMRHTHKWVEADQCQEELLREEEEEDTIDYTIVLGGTVSKDAIYLVGLVVVRRHLVFHQYQYLHIR